MEIIPVLISYLLGSVPFGYLIAKSFGIRDIREHGSGNIGATNVIRVIGPKAGVPVYILDIAKGAAAVLIGKQFYSTYGSSVFSLEIFLLTCAIAAILGHIFPLFIKFKGGKGASTILGAVMVLMPLESAVTFLVFVVMLFSFRYVSLATMTAGTSLFVNLSIQKYYYLKDISDTYYFLGFLIMVLLVFTHRSNIKRLISKTESRFTISRKTKVENHV